MVELLIFALAIYVLRRFGLLAAAGRVIRQNLGGRSLAIPVVAVTVATLSLFVSSSSVYGHDASGDGLFGFQPVRSSQTAAPPQSYGFSCVLATSSEAATVGTGAKVVRIKCHWSSQTVHDAGYDITTCSNALFCGTDFMGSASSGTLNVTEYTGPGTFTNRHGQNQGGLTCSYDSVTRLDDESVLFYASYEINFTSCSGWFGASGSTDWSRSTLQVNSIGGAGGTVQVCGNQSLTRDPSHSLAGSCELTSTSNFSETVPQWFWEEALTVVEPTVCGSLVFDWPNTPESWEWFDDRELGVSWEEGNHPSALYIRYPGLDSSQPFRPGIDDEYVLFGAGGVDEGRQPLPGNYRQFFAPWQGDSDFPSTFWWLDSSFSVTIPLASPTGSPSTGELSVVCIKYTDDGTELLYLDPSAENPEPEEVAPLIRACRRLRVERLPQTFVSGAVSYDPVNEMLLAIAPPLPMPTTDPVTVEYLNPSDVWVPILEDEIFDQVGLYQPLHVVAVPDPADSLSYQTLRVRCYDSAGLWVGGTVGTHIPAGGSPSDDPDSCYASAGMGLNPSSWVPSLVRMGGCVLQTLFIPDGDVISSEWKGLYESLEESIPFAWVIAGYVLVQTAAIGTQSAAASNSGGCFAVIPSGGELLDTDGTGDFCPAVAMATTFPQLQGLRPWLGYGVYLAFAYSMYGLLFARRSEAEGPDFGPENNLSIQDQY